jgi:hypothetical protein
MRVTPPKPGYAGMNIHREFWTLFNRDDHKALANWAADCAEHVLPFYEDKYPADQRPCAAIETLKEWIETGDLRMSVIRHASLAAHAAAREVGEASAARFAARAAGQAVATAHVPTHALGPALYAVKAAAAANPANAKDAVAGERAWQSSQLPENLRGWVISGLRQKQQLLPRNLRE